MLLKSNLFAFISLEKLEITDEVNNQLIVMDNENCRQAEVRLDVSFKFRHVGGGNIGGRLVQTVKAFGQENRN